MSFYSKTKNTETQSSEHGIHIKKKCIYKGTNETTRKYSILIQVNEKLHFCFNQNSNSYIVIKCNRFKT